MQFARIKVKFVYAHSYDSISIKFSVIYELVVLLNSSFFSNSIRDTLFGRIDFYIDIDY